jgi:hypothetical protein
MSGRSWCDRLAVTARGRVTIGSTKLFLDVSGDDLGRGMFKHLARRWLAATGGGRRTAGGPDAPGRLRG